MLILPFLIIAGASALAPVSKVDALDLTRFLSREEKVQIRKLTNGVTTFIQENPHPRQCASFRVVMKGASHEDAFFSLDTSMESTEAVEQFFNFCQENCQGSQSSMGIGEGALTCGFQSTFDLPSRNGSGQNLAVIAVGDFVESAMLSMIEHYFDALAFNEDPEAVAMPIQIGKSSMGSGVALHIDYPLKRSELQTYGDLKESWLHIFAQELLQQIM